jgi:hypothetical protein
LGQLGKQKGKPNEKQPKTRQDGIGKHKNAVPNKSEYMMKEQLDF